MVVRNICERCGASPEGKWHVRYTYPDWLCELCRYVVHGPEGPDWKQVPLSEIVEGDKQQAKISKYA